MGNVASPSIFSAEGVLPRRLSREEVEQRLQSQFGNLLAFEAVICGAECSGSNPAMSESTMILRLQSADRRLWQIRVPVRNIEVSEMPTTFVRTSVV